MKRKAFKRKLEHLLYGDANLKICFGCGESDPAIMTGAEKHHIHGKTEEDLRWACPSCHQATKTFQNALPPKVRSEKANKKHKEAMWLVSTGSTLRVIANNMIKVGFEICDEEISITGVPDKEEGKETSNNDN